MTSYQFTPRGVCSRSITFDLDDGKVHNVAFMGGCSGNLKAIGKLIEGADAQHIIDTLEGNTCGPRPTSCTDQLTIALKQALAQQA